MIVVGRKFPSHNNTIATVSMSPLFRFGRVFRYTPINRGEGIVAPLFVYFRLRHHCCWCYFLVVPLPWGAVWMTLQLIRNSIITLWSRSRATINPLGQERVLLALPFVLMHELVVRETPSWYSQGRGAYPGKQEGEGWRRCRLVEELDSSSLW